MRNSKKMLLWVVVLILVAVVGQDMAMGQLNRAEIEAVVRDVLAKEKESGLLQSPKASDWLENLTFYGDMRLRYHFETFSSSTAKDLNKARFRLRLGGKKTWPDDQLEVGFRLATGSSSSPTSTNQTFTGNAGEKKVWIDLAYAKYTPDSLKGFQAVAGKMKNPFVHTNMIWDGDVNLEGVWGVYKHTDSKSLQPFFGAGYFLLAESTAGHNSTLAAYQIGVVAKPADGVKWTTAATYYDFNGYETAYTAAGGNTVSGGVLSAMEFDVINLTTKVACKVAGVPVNAYGDWAFNTGSMLASKQSNAAAIGLKVGKNKKKSDWSAKYKYAYIQSDASPGGFNDSDFGFSNVKGHEVGVVYNIRDQVTASVRLFYTQPVSGAAAGAPRFMALLDLMFKW